MVLSFALGEKIPTESLEMGAARRFISCNGEFASS